MATTLPGLILLYWDRTKQQWTDIEDFTVNGGSTLGQQWFRIPTGFNPLGNDMYEDERDYALNPDSDAVYKVTPKLQYHLLTEPNSQLPYLEVLSLSGSAVFICWFIETPHNRFARQ